VHLVNKQCNCSSWEQLKPSSSFTILISLIDLKQKEFHIKNQKGEKMTKINKYIQTLISLCFTYTLWTNNTLETV